MKTAAIILEEDISSEAGANGVTLTLHDLLSHGLAEYNALVVGKWCHTSFPSAEFIPVRSQKRREYIDGMSRVISKIKADVIIVLQSFRFALLAKKLRP